MTTFLILLCLLSNNNLENGTLLFSTNSSFGGRIADRCVGGGYTHTAIFLDGYIYEADFPFIKKTKLEYFTGRRCSTNYFYKPKVPFTPQEVCRMKKVAESLVGHPYRLQGYFRPWIGRANDGTWCSPYVAKILNSSGRYNICKCCDYDPQRLFNRIKCYYEYIGTKNVLNSRM